jgi:hypothetical protein
MHIDSYEFGRIVVDGKEYTNDLLLLAEGVRPDWWRERGHSLYEADLKEVLHAAPDLLVIGTGAFGRMDVPPETWEALQAAGIHTVIKRTDEAVEAYNQAAEEGQNVAAAFHVTC